MRVFRCAFAWAVVLILATGAKGTLTEEQILLVVNGNSEVSAYVADMYREYYPGIPENQVIKLSGLPDCASASATAADEIITRQQYESLIAQPLRDHLQATGLVNDIYCIVTTAGLPYRIEDEDPQYGDVIKPAGSDAGVVAAHYGQISAASVESELALLWPTDPALDEWPVGPRVHLHNRVVNPYQGYHSPITAWTQQRDLLTRRLSFRWTNVMLAGGAIMEGLFDVNGLSALDRLMSPADLYLVVRLDGPRNTGQWPIFAVREMLERSQRVRDPAHVRFAGYSPLDSVVVFDHAPAAPGGNLVNNIILNFPPTWDFGDGEEPLWTIGWEDFPVPPTSEVSNGRDDYFSGFEMLTGQQAAQDQLTVVQADWGLGSLVYLDHTSTMMRQTEIGQDESLFALATFGKNSDDGRNRQYLKDGGPAGRPLFRLVPGAVFASAESFNAVTMFLNYNTYQAKVADFLYVGGSGAAGHAFEPMADALIDTEFLFANLVRDEDGDDMGDLCFAEAAFSALPYLSWAEVVVGDPLMRLHLGPGAKIHVDDSGAAFEPGDYNGDGIVGPEDGNWILAKWGAVFGDDRYDDRVDFDRDGYIGEADLNLLIDLYGTDYNTLSEDEDAWTEGPQGDLATQATGICWQGGDLGGI